MAPAIRLATTRYCVVLRACFLAILIVIATPARAMESLRGETLRIDSQRSHAEFSLRAMLLMVVSGQFTAVSGSVTFDRERDVGWVDARIDANSLVMSSAERKQWARSDEFFDSARHPEIRFVSEPISRTLMRDGGPLRGRLSLRGIDRNLELTVSPTDCDEPGSGCPLHVRGGISRSDFGMTSKRAVLGDRVTLDISVFVVPPDKLESRSGIPD